MGLLFTEMEASRWHDANRCMNPLWSPSFYICVVSVHQLQKEGMAWIGTDSLAVGFQHCPHVLIIGFCLPRASQWLAHGWDHPETWVDLKPHEAISLTSEYLIHRSALVSSQELIWMDIIGEIRVQYSTLHRSHSEFHKHFGDTVCFIALPPSLKMEFSIRPLMSSYCASGSGRGRWIPYHLHSSTDRPVVQSTADYPMVRFATPWGSSLASGTQVCGSLLVAWQAKQREDF